MIKEQKEKIMREFASNLLTPTQDERSFVSQVYNSFQDILGKNNCRQIGSFPRFTAIRPIHDLDILFNASSVGSNDIQEIKTIIDDLYHRFQKDYKNPTPYRIEVRQQTHSIGFAFLDTHEEEAFAVDVVPGFPIRKNEYGDDIYKVPEVIRARSSKQRRKLYTDIQAASRSIDWIVTDPLGYISQAKELNDNNDDFRKSVKLLKGWKYDVKSSNDDFKLKSFHIEQVITEDLKIHLDKSIYDLVFHALITIREQIDTPCIKDRADNSKFIDQYVADLTTNQRNAIISAIDGFLIVMEHFPEDVTKLMEAEPYNRPPSEEFLFDKRIPVHLDDNYTLNADGNLSNADGYRPFKVKLSNYNYSVPKQYSIEFFFLRSSDYFELNGWKVRNDDCSPQPRGDLHLNNSRTRPEKTSYFGHHYIECYGIISNVCVARCRVPVHINS